MRNLKSVCTFNGMPTHNDSGNPLVTLFSIIGASRGKNLRKAFETAYEFDRVKALKILLWARDIRGGSGERETFRNLLKILEIKHPEDVEMLMPFIPSFGRWDDLLVFNTHEMRQKAYSIIAAGLKDATYAGLVAKWLPRKGKIALEIESFLGLTPTAKGFQYTEGKAYPGKSYRHMLSTLSNTVEQKMCKKSFDEIVFDHVPSMASARYQKAFNRHCGERYQEYRKKLKNGTAKINANAVYPHDIIKSISNGGQLDVAEAQWNALPNYLDDQNMLAMVDVSGSMTSEVTGSKLTCLDVAISLGLYIADKAKGSFKDCFLTFSGTPMIEVLKGSIVQKYEQMKQSHWGMNTNLMGAFMKILDVGKKHGVDDSDMPKILLILSDMEFDQCVKGNDHTAMTGVKELYDMAGYTLPKIVFWNLHARFGNSPVTFREDGTALVSGFSPAIMKSILSVSSMRNFTPETVMEDAIGNPKYDVIGKPIILDGHDKQ